MRKLFIIPMVTVGFAALIFASPTPASSLPAAAVPGYSQTNAGIVQDVGKPRYKNERHSRNWNKRNSYRSHAYRDQPYGHRYRPYGNRYQPYAYADPYDRPGVTLRFGF